MAGNQAGLATSSERPMTDTAKKRPDMAIYFVASRENAPWVQIGAAWQHRDGDGYAMRFDLMPTTPGDIVLRKPKPKPEAGA